MLLLLLLSFTELLASSLRPPSSENERPGKRSEVDVCGELVATVLLLSVNTAEERGRQASNNAFLDASAPL